MALYDRALLTAARLLEVDLPWADPPPVGTTQLFRAEGRRLLEEALREAGLDLGSR